MAAAAARDARSLKRSHSRWRCPEQIRPGDPVVLRHPHAPWPIVVSEDSEEEERPTTTETSRSSEDATRTSGESRYQAAWRGKGREGNQKGKFRKNWKGKGHGSMERKKKSKGRKGPGRLPGRRPPGGPGGGSGVGNSTTISRWKALSIGASKVVLPRCPVDGESTANKHVAVHRASDKIREYYMSMLCSLNLGLLDFLDSGDSNA